MARILVHAMAATAGGGANYLRQLGRRLAPIGTEHQWLILPPANLENPPISTGNVRWLAPRSSARGWRRLVFDQWGLRRLIDRERVDLILATANFGMIRPPVPQVLLNRNALYFCPHHIRELRQRRDLRQILGTVARRNMALASIRSSQVNVVPTTAFGRQIQDWLSPGEEIEFVTLPFGFDHETFARREPTGGTDVWADRLSPREGVRRVLMVSHYNYFRNFETLLRAVPMVKEELPFPIEVILTTRLAEGLWHDRYDSTGAAQLIRALGIEEDVTQLGTVLPAELPSLYRKADVVVCPSYAESFGHPMVEAMACGRALVAADQPVHREVCQNAAEYFPTFDARALADLIVRALREPVDDGINSAGRQRSLDFSWDDHFRSLVHLLEATLKEEQHVRV